MKIKREDYKKGLIEAIGFTPKEIEFGGQHWVTIKEDRLLACFISSNLLEFDPSIVFSVTAGDPNFIRIHIWTENEII